MYVFVVGMERCGTHSAANILRSAASAPAHVIHEEPPTWCREARLLFEGRDFRTPAFKKKIAMWRDYHKKCRLVCEANHRLSFFTSILMREFAPDCRFVFLVRDPMETIHSRVATWAHYTHFPELYPRQYWEEMEVPEIKREFNDFRISPPWDYKGKALGELYAWEWIETYKYARNELQMIPSSCRKIMRCEELSNRFHNLFDYIGPDYFKLTDEVVGWAKTKSDSIQNRTGKHFTVSFAKKTLDESYNTIKSVILDAVTQLPKTDPMMVEMDAWVEGYLRQGTNKYATRIFV